MDEKPPLIYEKMAADFTLMNADRRKCNRFSDPRKSAKSAARFFPTGH
jgi:hypothetical protein